MSGSELFWFILGEIRFLLFMAVLVYFFWIRPKRMEKREEAEARTRTFFPGDRLLFNDGMVGELVKRSTSYMTVTSGRKKETYERRSEDLLENLSYNERKKEADKKLTLKEKILRSI